MAQIEVVLTLEDDEIKIDAHPEEELIAETAPDEVIIDKELEK